MSVYHYRGAEEETVPSVVQTVVVDPSVLELPWYFRKQLHPGVKEVILHEGLKSIRGYAFRKCRMKKITIYTTRTRAICGRAFEFAKRLETVDFISSPPDDASSDGASSDDDASSDASSSCDGLTVIEEEAFADCSSLQRIKIPETVEIMGQHVFSDCSSLVEVNLSRSSVEMISPGSFDQCVSLQAIWMPYSLEYIGAYAFRNCFSLVTVMLPQFAESLVVQMGAFIDCSSLANIELPKNHSSGRTAFEGCTLLEDFLDEELEDFEEDEDDSVGCHIATGLVNRFLSYPIHKLCYHSDTTRAVDLLAAVNNQNHAEMLTSDTFCMTPFHVLCSSVEPHQDLFEILLEKYPCEMLRWKDENDKEAMDYLMSNWTPKTAALLAVTAQRWMLDPLNQWGIKSRKLDMERQMQDVMNATTKENKSTVWNKACDTFEVYSKLESMSILEMALWGNQIKNGWNADRTKKIDLDRYQCLNQCGSGVVLPGIGAFLGLELVHSHPSRTDRLWKVL